MPHAPALTPGEAFTAHATSAAPQTRRAAHAGTRTQQRPCDLQRCAARHGELAHSAAWLPARARDCSNRGMEGGGAQLGQLAHRSPRRRQVAADAVVAQDPAPRHAQHGRAHSNTARTAQSTHHSTHSTVEPTATQHAQHSRVNSITAQTSHMNQQHHSARGTLSTLSLSRRCMMLR
jgi:hypothetical protein